MYMMESMAKSLMEFYSSWWSQEWLQTEDVDGDEILDMYFDYEPLQIGTETDSGMKVNILMTLIIAEAGQVQRLS